MQDIEKKYNKLRQQVVSGVIKLLEQDDLALEISPQILDMVANEIGMNPNYYAILFPKGLSGVMQEVSAHLDQQSLQQMTITKQLNESEKPSIRGKIKKLLKTRIIDSANLQAQRRIQNYFAKPQNAAINLQVSLKTCDMIWRYAGDQSTDFNYYSKRVLLLTVYKRSMRFYLNDTSEGYAKTSEFIQNALDNIVNVASLKNKIKWPKKEDIPIIRLFS